MAEKQNINTKIQNTLPIIEVFVKYENPCAVVPEQNFTSMDSGPETFFKLFTFSSQRNCLLLFIFNLSVKMTSLNTLLIHM